MNFLRIGIGVIGILLIFLSFWLTRFLEMSKVNVSHGMMVMFIIAPVIVVFFVVGVGCIIAPWFKK